MAEDKRSPRGTHHVVLEDRRLLTITGVTDIDSFDEHTVLVYTDAGELTIRGEGLHINKINLEVGELSLEGDVWGLEYTDNIPARGGLFGRLFR